MNYFNYDDVYSGNTKLFALSSQFTFGPYLSSVLPYLSCKTLNDPSMQQKKQGKPYCGHPGFSRLQYMLPLQDECC